jgi:quinol monooxygenase YgiN
MRTVTILEAFEVLPEEDEAFLAGVLRPRDGTAPPRLVSATVLYRALREDATLRWVAVTRLDTPDASTRSASDAAYEEVHDEGAVDDAGGVVLIVAFEVPAAGDERFRAAWEEARAADARQPGCLGTRLHRSLGPARLRWVQISRWSSPLMVHRARQLPEVRRAAEELPTAQVALYLVVGT